MLNTIILPFVNLLMLVGILVWKLKIPLGEFLKARHITIKSEIDTARLALQKAQSDHEEFSSRLSAVEGEIATMKSETRQGADSLKSSLVTRAKEGASALLRDARETIGGMESGLLRELRVEFAEKVVIAAEGRLNTELTGEHRARIRKEFSARLGNNGS